MAPASTPLRNETGLIRRLPVLGYRLPVPTSERPGGTERTVDAARRCAAPGCRKRVPAGAHRLAVYCSDACRRAARNVRQAAAARARRAANGAEPAAVEVAPAVDGAAPLAPRLNEVAVEPLAVEPAVRASVAAASGPAAADGIVGLVVELIERGAEVELERGGWRLRVHPR